MGKFFGENNLIKKLCTWIFTVFMILSFFSVSLWDYNSFLSNLRQMWIDVDSILKSKSVDRYELARLLNWVNCKDCINPENDITSLYNYQWWNNFSNRDGNAFNDITYLWWNYKWESYYYCVAYVWDNSWMRWYPSGVSPICDWKFCGTRTTTVWEFLQVVLNIADQYVYKKYLVNWTKVKTWMDWLVSWSYADTYLTSEEKTLINQYAKEKKSWAIPDETAFQAYIKYCMFNLEDCGMQKFGVVWQGYWPVAELNILYDNNIVEYEKFEDGQTSQLVDGKYVLETLYNLFQLIDCSFDYDYDCDWIINKNDNCPNTYNLNQTDTDWDWLWDVCDDDIDWDGIKNPLWIVDDLWNVIISKYKNGMDNCLFMPNLNQSDSDKNWFGDVCDQLSNGLWMYIHVSPIKTTAPATVAFQAITEWNTKWDFQRSFGDWTVWNGKTIVHTFDKFGLYTVQVTVEWYGNNARATTTVFIWKDIQNDYALQINSNKQKINAWDEVVFSINKQWNFDSFQINFGDWNTIEQNDAKNITKRFRDEWTYMITIKWFKDGKIVAVANTIIWVWQDTYASNMTLSSIYPNKKTSITAKTDISWFSENDISNIVRDFWDEQIINKNLTQEHTYQKDWIYVIMQTISLNNGVTLNNFSTVYVWNTNMNSSYSIENIPNHLVWLPTDTFGFSTQQVWNLPATTLYVANYWDWQSTRSYENLSSRPKSSNHQYSNGIFMPKATIYVDDCIALSTESTIVVDAWDFCLKALLDWTLNNFTWDIDHDGIPDICDDDIDGDGMPNLIWIYNNNNWWDNPILWDNNINPSVLWLHKSVCQLDNCPTISNKNQLDLNNNGWWDNCDDINIYKNLSAYSSNILSSNFGSIFNNSSSQSNWTDSDGDWISDSLDACPTLPENYNWIQDFDGCPEIWATNNCSLTSYDYINRDFSVYPTIQTYNSNLYITDPDSPTPSCKWDACKNLCLWDVSKCSSCNWNTNCELCRQHPEFCGSITGGTGPYVITARCQPEHIYHVRNNVTNLDFSFANTFNWSCPCKKCSRFVKDINWNLSNIWNFSVCNEECSSSTTWDDNWDRIDIDDPDDIIPPCEWETCNVCRWKNCNNACIGNTNECNSCNWEKNCELCRQDPDKCGTRSGGTWPYELQARCDDDVTNVYKWTNITIKQFSFSEYFKDKNECRDCHRIVKDINWLTSPIWYFQICPSTWGTHWPTGNVTPSCVWNNCHINECTGSNCTSCIDGNCVCVWDIQDCPDCPDSTNPACNANECTLHPESCACRSGRDQPVSISARCESNPSDIHEWTNISGDCLSFDNIFPNINPNECDVCHRYLIDSGWVHSNTETFNVCTNTWEISGPTGNVTPSCVWSDCHINECTWSDCNSCTDGNCVCVWNIQDCPDCPDSTNPACNANECTLHPESCACRSGRNQPVSISAWCESNPSDIHEWTNVSGDCLSFDDIFPNTEPNQCDICHRYLTSVEWIFSNTGDFSVCNSWINIVDPERPEYTCTGDNCNTCEWSDCDEVCIWDVNNCNSCNWDKNCELCQQNPSLCGSWSGGQWPYELQARCDNDLAHAYTWRGITDMQFSFTNIWTWECPCRECNRKIKDSNWLISNTGHFQVCAEECNTWIDPIPVPDTPGCEWDACNNVCTDDVNNCPCAQNPNCPDDECQKDPDCTPNRDDPNHSACWTWNAKWPYTVTARCDDDGKEVNRSNISWQCINLSGKFETKCEPRSCHRRVTSANWLKSKTSDFTIQALNSNECISPSGPDPIPGCEWDDCNNICQWDLTKCPCENNPSCSAQECWNSDICNDCENSELSATRETEIEWPYDLTARCPAIVWNTMYTWENIWNSCLNLSNVFEWDCPCKTCFRYVKSSSWTVKSAVTPFQVCDNACNPTPRIEPEPGPGPWPWPDPNPTPGCEWDACNDVCTDDVNNCPCAQNPNCPDDECQKDPDCPPDRDDPTNSACWTWTAKWPYTVTARCDDNGKEINRSNISWQCISLSGKFEAKCEPRSCHRFVTSADWIQSKTSDFTIQQLDSNECLDPTGPDPIPGCSGNNCNTCQWDISKCPCKNNPSCSSEDCGKTDKCWDCSNSNFAARWKTKLMWPFTVTVSCLKDTNLHIRSNITNHCIWLDGALKWTCPCDTCQRSVSAKVGKKMISSPRKKFQVCGEWCNPSPNPEPSPIIADWPEWPVLDCEEGKDCNDCIWDVSNCDTPWWGGWWEWWGSGSLCWDNQESPESNGTWIGGVEPYTVTAWCDWVNNEEKKQRNNIYGQCFPFEKYFPWDCPCNQCHWFVEDSNWNHSDILNFKVCKEECKWWDDDNPPSPTPTPDGPITTPECLSCPCIYTDYGNNLSLNDDVKAILLDLDMNTLYSESIPVWIMQYLNE